MTKLVAIECNPEAYKECSHRIVNSLEENSWVQLLPKMGGQDLIPSELLPEGPGVILASGGSAGGPHQCLLTCSHLDQSAIATAEWLTTQGVEPQHCLILNPLPIHHVSGLMPWWRSLNWGSSHTWLLPSLMRNPIELEQSCQALFKRNSNPLIISLVPTQLKRLLKHASGVRWLKCFEVIWVGGSSLSTSVATAARTAGIKLAPCYGATETTAMVTVLSPEDFLAGETGCGSPLNDVELCLNQDGALRVRTARIAQGRWKNGYFEKLVDVNGWWQSEDAAELKEKNCLQHLVINGRMDTAIHSGGETVFPEILESRLLEAASTAQIPIRKLILLPTPDQEWGQRLVALVSWNNEGISDQSANMLLALKRLVKDWLPAERPIGWYECPELETNATGKWERIRWECWLQKNKLRIKL